MALPDRFELKDKTIVVTGTSRGIGLEFVKQLLAKGNKVIATARNVDASPGLKLLKSSHADQLTLMALNVDDAILINNAGILTSRRGIDDVTPEDMMSHFLTNCMGQIFVVQPLLKHKLLPPGSLIANVTSLFVNQLLAKNNKVFATARNPDASPGLKLLKANHRARVALMTLDVDDVASIKVVINNAGIFDDEDDIEDVTPDSLMSHFRTNCMGQIFVVQALLRKKLLKPGSLIANVTSLVASIEENEGGGLYSYRCSKAAANMATKSMSIDLEPQGITCTILHPGYVRTDMTEGAGFIDVDESIRGLLAVLESGKKLHGEWYHTTGRHLPW